MSRYLLLAVVGVVTLTTGVLGGLWEGRWGVDQGPPVPLEQLPLTFGDWRGEAQQLDKRVIDRAGFDAYIVRHYENQRTGAVVSLLVARGRQGPLSVHTPEVCYGGAGFALTGAPARWSPTEGGPDGFWKATFAKKDSAATEKLRVLWGWYHKGAWKTAENPRWTFAGTPVLYKVYVTQAFFPRDEATDGEGCLEFLRDFVPEFTELQGQHP
jgi:Protein of unknown function (DUF3485)